MGRYAIGDIHGCANSFTDLLMKIGLGLEDELYLLGDYIDRGDSSKQVFDQIFELLDKGFDVKSLRGNHEEMMLQSIEDPETPLQVWLENGGKQTLKSFRAYYPEFVGERYLEFMHSLNYWLEAKDFFLVHASFNFKIADFRTDKHAMLWDRSHKHSAKHLGESRILHGHTPKLKEEILNQFEGEIPLVINLDGGCVHKGRKDGFGNLFALDMDRLEPIWVPNSDF